MQERAVYLDYNATTPVDPAVVEVMVPSLTECFGNPSSMHEYGYQAKAALDTARRQVAALIGAAPNEVVFTAGGSETDNLAIQGIVFANLDRTPHVITSTIEHPAVLNTLAYLRSRFAIDTTFVPVNEYGRVDPERVRGALRPTTVLVTIMHANNEVGTIQPVAEIAAVLRDSGALLHVDAAQTIGKIPVDVRALGVDLLTISSHKLYGPKGMGALYVRSGVRLDPLVHGSGQECGMRAGTENIAGAVGLGKAAEIALDHLTSEPGRLLSLRDELFHRLQERVPGIVLNGHPTERLPNTLNVSMPGASGQAVLSYAPAVAASTGSACHAGAAEPSPVLMAMGLGSERGLGAIRLSLGRWSTRSEMERAAEALAAAYRTVTEGMAIS